MKSDSKVCMDSLSDNPSVPNWAISNGTFNILNSALSFLCCSFVWARRFCNVAAHIAAKLALSLASPLCFNEENLPEVILSACVVDSSNVDSSFSVEWYWSLAKKKKRKRKKSQTFIWETNNQNNCTASSGTFTPQLYVQNVALQSISLLSAHSLNLLVS